MEFNLGMITKIFILSMLATLKTTESSNILAVFPTPSFSHQLPLLNLARQLAKRGHNVVTITANPGVYEPIENYHEIDFSIMYKLWLKLQEEQNFSLQKKISAFEIMVPISAWSGQFMDALYKMEPVQRLLRSNESSFDLLLYEGLYPSALGFKHHFNNIPSVVMITIPLYNSIQYSMGNPINPSYMTSFLSDYSDKMTFFQRVRNTVLVLFEIYVHQYHYYYHSDLVMKKYFGENAPSVQELEKSNNLFLLSGDLSQSYPTPFQPNTIPVGTLHVDDKVKPLPADLQKFMDEAEDGVIYFSLGSNMKGVNVPVDIRNSFAKAFAKFPKIKVLWKWESDVEFPGKPSNVLLRKWLPQHSILAHPNLRLFITQGGQQSRQELIHYAVPTLTVPLFWDQPWNGKKLEAEGAGLVLEFYDVTYETLYEKLKLLLTDSSFKENMIRLSNISKDKPTENKDLAAWWVEYVIRHKGAPHLRPAVQDLKWYQYTLLDVAAFILSVIFITLYIIYFIVKKIVTKFFNGKQKKLKST